MPPDDRRAERRALLLEAALELLGTEGWSGTTVRGICQEARLNPRYFYESFDDLDELIVALYDRLVAQLGEAVVAAVEATDDRPDAQTRAALDTTLRFVEDDPRRARVLYVEALGNESLNRRRRAAGNELVTALGRLAREKGHRPDGDQIGTIAAAITVGGTSEMVIAWLDGRIDLEREQLVDHATAMFVAMGERAGQLTMEPR